MDTESPSGWGEHVVCKAEAGTLSAKTFRKHCYKLGNSRRAAAREGLFVTQRAKLTTPKCFWLSPLLETVHFVCPQTQRSIEKSAWLCLALVQRPSWAVHTPNLGTTRLKYYLLSPVSTNHKGIFCNTPQTTQKSLCGGTAQRRCSAEALETPFMSDLTKAMLEAHEIMGTESQIPAHIGCFYRLKVNPLEETFFSPHMKAAWADYFVQGWIRDVLLLLAPRSSCVKTLFQSCSRLCAG